MSKKNITILGAGLVGSLLAVLLRKRGYQVHIIERRPDMRLATGYAGRSINLAMSHRGWQAVEQAGLKAQLSEIALPMYGRYLHQQDGGEAFQAYGKNNEAIYSVSRAELNKTLMTAAQEAGTTFQFDTRCTHVDIATNTCTIEHNGITTTHLADLLIAADGAFSSLRQAYTQRDRQDYHQFYIEHGYKELCIPAAQSGEYLLRKDALHIWPRKNFMLIALPNIDGSFTLTLFFPFNGKPSFNTVQTEADIHALFDEYFASAKKIMPTLVEDFLGNPTSSLVTVKTSPWVHQDKSLLIGDAAHAIVPFYGQGMNAGFEDCVELCKLIDENEAQDWQQILQRYNKIRVPNGNAVAQLALNNFVEMRDLVADPAFLERKKIEKELGLRYPTIFNSVYEMVSFSHTPYRIALATTQAQNDLYQKICAHTNNFFESINDSSFCTQLDDWMQVYNVIASKIKAGE